MPKNKIIGKNKSSKAKLAYQAAYNKRPDEVARRVELNGEARKRKIYGKRHANGVDLSHTKSGKMVLEKRSTNRARNGKNGKSTKK